MLRHILIAAIASLTATVPMRDVAAAPLQSQGSSFGGDTITFDPNTGLQWLDLTVSIGYSKSEMDDQIQPGGVFEGYHFATNDEIRQLFIDAGIDVGPGSDEFIAANYEPIVQLANLIGVLGANGNCGGGCTFYYAQGYTAEPPPFENTVAVTGVSWFDNDPPQSPSYPQAPIGRVLFGGGRSDGASSDVGSWLIVPEPDVAVSFVAALLVIASRCRARRNYEGVVTR
jgi:hypothetical protein